MPEMRFLHNVSLNCEKGKITTLIGPNGSGKSTLLKSVIGMLPIQNGEIKIDGVSVQELPENIRAQKIAYLSQGKNIPDITVSRMVLHGRFPYLSYPRKYRRCDYAAEKTAMITMGINELADLPLVRAFGRYAAKRYILPWHFVRRQVLLCWMSRPPILIFLSNLKSRNF